MIRPPNFYGVRLVKLIAPPPARPASCSPASVSQVANNQNVIVTGTYTYSYTCTYSHSHTDGTYHNSCITI